jgi:hypothetical protein
VSASPNIRFRTCPCGEEIGLVSSTSAEFSPESFRHGLRRDVFLSVSSLDQMPMSCS